MHKRTFKSVSALILIAALWGTVNVGYSGGYVYGEKLPVPDYDNTVIFSFYYDMLNNNESEVRYLKSQFGNALYARLHISRFLGLDLNWNKDLSAVDTNLQGFKDIIEGLIEIARRNDVGIHIGLTLGLARSKYFYRSAKQEDIRNAQWYTDNTLASAAQLSRQAAVQSGEQGKRFELNRADGEITDQPSAANAGIPDEAFDSFVFGTLSRYARKLRTHLDTKVKAAFAYLERIQRENPDVLILISGPGEAELNYKRQDNSTSLQTYFCDYSPFAVLEFRDWLKHEGMYGVGGLYYGEGYAGGGTRYQGTGGLVQFNSDFGTAFATWDLKYYDWSLADPVDTNYTDNVNPDPKSLPIADYSLNGMMPTSGSGYISGGFDPPRVMLQKGENAYWDLWQQYRETMVYHYVKDIAKMVEESGFPKNQFFSHQIPADYLFGTRPNDPAMPYLNNRYYSSASALWTAKNDYGTGMGITMYDINYVTHYAATSKYVLDVISGMADNWCVVEYNPEIIVSGNENDINTVQYIYEQMKRLYDRNVHAVCFFKWKDTLIYQYKGYNREQAAKKLYDAVKAKARQPVSTVFTPRLVKQFTGQYDAKADVIDLSWSDKIWSSRSYKWEDWGDFKEYVIYRGYSPTFPTTASAEVTRSTATTYRDTSFLKAGRVYYKIVAVNVNGEEGNPFTIDIAVPNLGMPILEVSREQFNFGAVAGEAAASAQSFNIANTGTGALVWTVTPNADWLSVAPATGTNDGRVDVTAGADGKAPGTYSGTITVGSSGAVGSPKTINVTLRVYAEGQDTAPQGKLETPLNNSTVQGSVPVTGWVVDDIAVEKVEIYRQEGSQLKYIDDATFVEGARPDIEAAFPDYPNNQKAGWGYMLLSNYLPNRGNGTFVLYAIATDSSGHQVTLGTTTINGDNDNAVRPFGAIDTPAQGGTASGSAYINFGWALTPQPNKIPTSGSTIYVYIDGIKQPGNVTYNNYRSDIAAMFPDYANADGAVGYYYIDTAKLDNGVHTIQWTVTDNGNNTDGIGSRFFTVMNTGAREYSGSRQQAKGNSRERTVYHRWNGVTRLDNKPVYVRRGYDNKEPQPQETGPDGNQVIRIAQLERVEIHLQKQLMKNPPSQNRYTGYLKVGDEVRRLPIGSTLDEERGIFYWQPGPGHFGQYRLVFLKKSLKGTAKKNITVNIVAKGTY